MPEEVLSALVTGEEQVSGVLHDVADEMNDLAGVAREVSEAMTGAAAGMDIAANSADDLADTFSDVTAAAGAAHGMSGELEEATEDLATTAARAVPAVETYESGLGALPEEMLEATVATRDTADAIDSVGDEATESAAQVTALGAAVSALPQETTVGVDTDIDGVAGTQGTVDGVAGAGIADIAAGVEGATEDLDGLRDALSALPDDARIDVSVADATDLSDSLSDAATEARTATDALRQLGTVDLDGETVQVDTLVEGTESLSDLRTQLTRAGGDAGEASRRLDALGATAEGLVDDALQGASSMDSLAADVDDAGQSAAVAAAELNLLEEQTGDLVGEAATSSATVGVLTERVDELGDEASGSALEVTGLSGAISGLGAVSGVSASLGPLVGNLGTIAKLAGPAAAGIASLGAAAGGVAVGGGGILGGLGALLAGGALSVGEQVAAADPTDDIETATEGLEQVFGDIRDRAAEIIEPLKSVASEELFFGVVSAGLAALEDAVTVVEELQSELLGFADAIGSAWSAVSPAVFEEIEASVRTFLPLIEDLATGAIQSLPGILAVLRRQGAQLAPILTDAGAAFVDLLPELARLGTMALSVAVPAITALLHVLDGVSPVINAVYPVVAGLGSALAGLVDVLGPVLEAFGAVVATALAVSKSVAVASAALSALSAVGSALSAVLSGGLLSSLVSVAGTILTLVNPITAVAAVAAGVITYFGWWDDIANVLVGTFNAWVGIMESVANTLWNVYQAVGEGLLLIPGLGQAIYGVFWLMENWDAVTRSVSNALKTLSSWIKQAGRAAKKWLGPIGELVGEMTQAGDGGKFDFSGAQIDQGGGGQPSGDASGGGPPRLASGASSPGRSRETGTKSTYAGRSEKTVYNEGDTHVTVDASGDTSETRIKKLAKEAVQEANKENRRRSTRWN